MEQNGLMRTLDGPRRGKRGKIVASRNRFGEYEREQGPQKTEATPARRRVWGNMVRSSSLWNRITEEQRKGWHRLANEERSRTTLGQSGRLDGQKLIIRLNTVLATCNREPILDAVPRGEFGPNPVTGIKITFDAGKLSFKLAVQHVPAEDIMVFASPPFNAGRSYCSIFSFIGLLRPARKGESEMSREYQKKLNEWRKLSDKRYHVPLEGSHVFIRAWQQENGWENRLAMFRGSAPVSAKPAPTHRSKGCRGAPTDR
jgi:hypothetical protein